jgi:hypothetical protein
VTYKWALLYIEKMVNSADDAGGWKHNREKPRHPTRWCGQSESVHALHVRSLDNADAPRPSLVSGESSYICST